MITNTNVRGYRAGIPSVRNPAKVVSGAGLQISGLFLKLLAGLLVAVVLVVFIGSLLVERQISRTTEQLMQQRAVHAELSTASIRLNVERVKLTSKQRIMSVAGDNLHLYEPDTKQIRRF